MCFAKKLLFGECVLVSYLSWFRWYKLVHRKIIYRHLTHTTHKNNVLRYTICGGWAEHVYIYIRWVWIFEIWNFEFYANESGNVLYITKKNRNVWIEFRRKSFEDIHTTSTSYTKLFRNLQINNFTVVWIGFQHNIFDILPNPMDSYNSLKRNVWKCIILCKYKYMHVKYIP